ncbi:hypothetical protein BH20ACT5_BH20ACT5_07610 [soil metagenome]
MVDGNKRLAWLATVVFVDLNGSAPRLDDDAAFELAVDVAGGRADVADVASRPGVEPR